MHQQVPAVVRDQLGDHHSSEHKFPIPLIFIGHQRIVTIANLVARLPLDRKRKRRKRNHRKMSVISRCSPDPLPSKDQILEYTATLDSSDIESVHIKAKKYTIGPIRMVYGSKFMVTRLYGILQQQTYIAEVLIGMASIGSDPFLTGMVELSQPWPPPRQPEHKVRPRVR